MSLLLLPLLACTGPPDDTAAATPPWSYPLDTTLRVTDGQVLGTHNSYHLRDDPMVTDEWDYAHLPLDEQAGLQGVRQFELDVHQETDGSFSVYHALGLDDESTCPTLAECLATLRAWSQAHPAHFPLFILIEPKDDAGGEPIDLDLLDAAVLAGWPDPYTPGELTGAQPTLLDAVTIDGWPTLDRLRGRAILHLLDSGAHRDAYVGQGRPLFTQPTDTADPNAAFFLMDDPTDVTIPDVVAAGFLVRTRIDEALGASVSEQTGAHTLSTDYPDEHAFPDGSPVRCNPVHVHPECTATALEDPAFMGAPG